MRRHALLIRQFGFREWSLGQWREWLTKRQLKRYLREHLPPNEPSELVRIAILNGSLTLKTKSGRFKAPGTLTPHE